MKKAIVLILLLFASQAWAGDFKCPKATIEQYRNEPKYKVTAWKKIWKKTEECLERVREEKESIPPGYSRLGGTFCLPVEMCVQIGEATVFSSYEDALAEYRRLIKNKGSKWERVK